MPDDRRRGEGGWIVVADAVHILLVSGDVGDVVVTQDDPEFFKVVNPVRVVTDGVTALRLVRRQPPFQGERRRDLTSSTSTCPGRASGSCSRRCAPTVACGTFPWSC